MAHNKKHSLSDVANHSTTSISALNGIISGGQIASESLIANISGDFNTKIDGITGGLAQLNNKFVDITGDTMTGDLNVNTNLFVGENATVNGNIFSTNLASISGNFITTDENGKLIDSQISYKDIYNLDTSLHGLVAEKSNIEITTDTTTTVDTIFFDQYETGYFGATWSIAVKSLSGDMRIEEIKAITDYNIVNYTSTEVQSIGDTSNITFIPVIQGNNLDLDCTTINISAKGGSWEIRTSRVTL